MSESALGFWLKELRADQDVSLRAAAKQAEADGGKLDHAYLYRLETGAKETPSDETVNRLITALKPSERDAQILQFLAKNPNINVGLAQFARRDPSVSFEEFHMLTTVVNRGTNADYVTSLTRIRRFMREDDDG